MPTWLPTTAPTVGGGVVVTPGVTSPPPSLLGGIDLRLIAVVGLGFAGLVWFSRRKR